MASGRATSRTVCGLYLTTTRPSASTRRSTIIGRINRPWLAMAHMAMTICKGVTSMPWPMGIRAREILVQLFTGGTLP